VLVELVAFQDEHVFIAHVFMLGDAGAGRIPQEHRRRPALAARIAGPIERAQRWALPVAMALLLIAAAPAMWKLVGDWTLVAMVLFVVSMVAIGHVLGGPDRQCSAVLAFASSCRHPATALTIASANFPNADERGAVALYGLVTVAIGALYSFWMRRRSADAVG